MPEDAMVPAGNYKVPKQFRNEVMFRRRKDLPWSKRVLDLDERKLFGRTTLRWFQIVMFYLVLYFLIAVLVIFWYLIFRVAFLDDTMPYRLKDQPGLSVVPNNQSVIVYYKDIMTDIYPLADKIDRYLHRLRDNAVEHFAECNKDELWGFSIGRPCFFVKLNNVMGFRPVTYDTPNDLKPTDPPSLADTIRKYGGAPKIWLDCKLDDGTYPKIEYIPGPYYAVSKNMKGVQRVVAVQLSEMPINRDVFVVCSAWARNIVIDREYNGRGHVRFALNMRQNTEKPNVDPVGGGGAGPVVRAGEGAGAAPDSAPDYYAGAAPDSSSDSGAGAAPDSEPVSGAGAAPDSAPYSDAGAAPDSAPDSGAGAAPDSSPDSGAGAAPDSEPDSGAGAAPDSGTGAAPDSEPNSAPYSDAEADPDSAPDSGAGAVPESDLRKQDMKQDMYYIPQIDKNLEPPEMSVVLPPAPELEPPENGKRKPLEPPTEPPSF